jgi:AcrR family transcriptional regulator
VVKDAAQTRAKLLAAAIGEFAAFGIAGARVDRIAVSAGLNKQLIYAHFGSKDELFDAVLSEHVAHFLSDVDFDANDLPGYAGRMFDKFDRDPTLLRLSTWYRLERPSSKALEAVAAVNQERLEKIRAAQDADSLSARFSPVELLSLIQATATSWSSMNPEFATQVPEDARVRRLTVVDAARRLTAGET